MARGRAVKTIMPLGLHQLLRIRGNLWPIQDPACSYEVQSLRPGMQMPESVPSRHIANKPSELLPVRYRYYL
uniref:Uncharacterized protein n=1 Tax=Coccidioides posadasii RMSCC 3488 TaxID=454284 RepID=A0A0J6FNJ5_COCPO|nr:hypothetical protein CPAG_06815 [Coccidioides posadasii RMSCC 3488]